MLSYVIGYYTPLALYDGIYDYIVCIANMTTLHA